jgi:hypothetical protein
VAILPSWSKATKPAKSTNAPPAAFKAQRLDHRKPDPGRNSHAPHTTLNRAKATAGRKKNNKCSAICEKLMRSDCAVNSSR